MWYMEILGWTGITLTWILMYCTQVHYTIDMIAGLIFAHYIFIFVKRWAPYFDRVVC